MLKEWLGFRVLREEKLNDVSPRLKWCGAGTKFNLRVSQVAHASIAQRDNH